VPSGVTNRLVLARVMAYVVAGICEIIPCRYRALWSDT
jgi:hypothetical protein